MNGRSVLSVSLLDTEGNAVGSADLELRSASGAYRSSSFHFDETNALFVSEPLDAGDYVLSVRAKGYLPSDVPLRLAPPSLMTSVILGREGQPYYMLGGRRIYFVPDGERIAALMRTPPATPDNADAARFTDQGQAQTRLSALEELHTLQAIDEPAPVRMRNLMTFDRAHHRRARDDGEQHLERMLRETSEVMDAGPVLRTRGAGVQFLSRFIEIIVEDGIAREQLSEAIKPFGVRISSQDRLDPRIYRVESDGVPGPEYGALPERLAELPEVRHAASIISAVDDHTAVAPTDALFPLQFHSLITRCPDAWEKVDPARTPQSYGSADVVVAVSDAGIATTTAPASVANHPEFSGMVNGGTLTARPGLNASKLLDAFDFNSSPMVRGNDLVAAQHGSWVAGVISASASASGVVGIAANTRLSSYIRAPNTASDNSAHALAYYAGLDPGWTRTPPYTPAEPFPFLLGSGGRPTPGAAVINASHTFRGSVTALMSQALQRISLFGRDRRGSAVFAAAGNDDRDLRRDGAWAENTNVIRVAASSLDLREEEVRMNYSDYSLAGDRIVDFSAPSESQNALPTVHEPPRLFGFVTADQTTASGDLPTTATAHADLTNAPAAGTRMLTSAGLDPFGVGQTVIVRDKGNPLHSEVHVIASKPAANTINTARDLGYSYAAGAGEVILLSGNTAYSRQFGGTSAAAPQASAIAALMISARPALTWLEVRELMRRTAVPIGLRYRGSRYAAPPNHRYRWLDPGGADLINADGLLDITGGDRTVVAGPVIRGNRILALNDLTGIAPRQALLIGAETKLNGNHPKPAPDQAVIDVDRSDDLEVGDTLFIGKDVQTVIIRQAAMGDMLVWVQSVDGIEPMDFIQIGAQVVQVNSIQRMSLTAGLVLNTDYIGDAETGLNLAAGLAAAHNRGDIVRLANTEFEGPFTVAVKAAGRLTLNNPVTQMHPNGRAVRKQGTEVKAVIRTLAGNRVEIDPLRFDHPFNAAGVERVRVGRVADYSHGFGRGRLDALEAVDAAKNYDHTERDLVVRNFLADDGVTNVAMQEVESPDLWVRNNAATLPADLPNYATPAPHQMPEITIDPAIHIGSGINDLEVSGACTSAAELTFAIEIDHTAATDTFKWNRNGGALTAAVAITGAAQALSDGVSIRFAALTGHTLADRWIVRARQVVNRFLHIRVRNRGTLPYFLNSTFSSPILSPTIVDVAQARILLCVSDGYPVCRFASVAAMAGPDDMQVVARYTGPNARALYTVEITATAPAGDTFQWYRDGLMRGTIVLAAATIEHGLGMDGVRVRFGSHTGHQVGDRWNIYARAGADAFLNIDHYSELLAPGGLDPATGPAGTRLMHAEPLSGFPANDWRFYSAAWPEALRPPTNNPNVAKAAHPRRLFVLGEAVPHDGALMGFTAKTNNNFSFRELSLARFRFAQDDGAVPLDPHLDVSNLGIATTKMFRVEVRSTAGTFAVERVRLKFSARRGGGPPEVRNFRYAGSWGWDTAPMWATSAVPVEALRPDGSQPAATGEQFDIQFDCTCTVDSSFTELTIEAQVLSDFRDFAVAAATHTIAIYAMAPVPTGTGAARAAARPRPSSFVFADTALLTQTAEQAFGPVTDPADADSLTTRYRATSLFRAASDVRAHAVVDGIVVLQRDPANNDAVNLILRPRVQPVSGVTPVRYFIYRGLRLADFLKGSAGADAKLMRPQAGASPFLTGIWTTFLALNPGATDMPSSIFGYDPDTQAPADLLDDIFFRVGVPTQLPLATKGIELGSFHSGGGAHDFGFEVVLEEGDYAPTLEYARKPSHEIDISMLPNGTPAEQFERRIKQDEILNFMDVAAYYGLHMHNGGRVEIPGNPPHVGQAIYSNIIVRFFTKNNQYLDIRSENGSSLNFQRNYDDGAGNQLQVAADALPLAPRPYATHGWPVVILDGSAAVNTPDDFNRLSLQLSRDDNENPVLYVEHGELLTPATDGAFVRDGQLHIGVGLWTLTASFRFPNTGLAGSRIGVAWYFRLYYGRLEVAAPTVPLPPTVLKTTKYTDNVFGPIDRISRWAGTAGIKWVTTQDNRYVDAEGAVGWRQMMQCGLAQQTSGTPRALLYAVATARDIDPAAPVDFVPLRGMPEGVSARSTFFTEPGLFGVYLLEHDQIEDGGTAVRTLQLRQNPSDGYAPSSALLLGLSKAEFDTLKALGAGMSTASLRTLLLDAKASLVDPNGHPYDRYRVGIQGLQRADGTWTSAFPPTDIRVYSVDGQFFASRDFAAAEPLPTVYARNYEEEKGARAWPQRQRRIASVNVPAHAITIAGYDWRREVVAGGKLRIAASAGNNGDFTVDSVTLNGADTVIVLSGGPVALGNADPLGNAFTLEKPVEDLMIDLDQQPAVLGIGTTRSLINGFVADVAAIANNAGARAAIQAKIDDVGPKILRRARELAHLDHSKAEDYERALYWARLRMTVAIKSHPFCLASLSARNALIDRLERKSRGYELDFAAAPGGAQKVLLTGFDPFQLDLDLETSNPSGAIALALHGRTITSSGKQAYVESAIFPVRYRDFDAGRVEDLVNPRLSGAGKVEMIMTVSQNGGSEFYDLERLAGRYRSGYYDNEYVTLAPRQIGQDATHAAFYETTLPAVAMVPGPFASPPDDEQRLFFDQSYEAVMPPSSFQDASDSGAPAGANTNMPAFILASIAGKALSGSGSNYLSNEVFYRVAQRRVQFASTTLTGHFHVPSPSIAKTTIADVITETEDLIKHWLDSLP